MAFSNFGNSSRESTISDSVFKVIIIGDHDVGKSSILTRYLEDAFSEEKVRTYGKIKQLTREVWTSRERTCTYRDLR